VRSCQTCSTGLYRGLRTYSRANPDQVGLGIRRLPARRALFAHSSALAVPFLVSLIPVNSAAAPQLDLVYNLGCSAILPFQRRTTFLSLSQPPRLVASNGFVCLQRLKLSLSELQGELQLYRYSATRCCTNLHRSHPFQTDAVTALTQLSLNFFPMSARRTSSISRQPTAIDENTPLASSGTTAPRKPSALRQPTALGNNSASNAGAASRSSPRLKDKDVKAAAKARAVAIQVQLPTSDGAIEAGMPPTPPCSQSPPADQRAAAPSQPISRPSSSQSVS